MHIPNRHTRVLFIYFSYIVISSCRRIVSVPPLLSTKGSGSTTKAPLLCQNRWSTWINTDTPSTGDGDREILSKAQQQAFCSNGNVTDIECVTSDGIPFYSTGEIIICSIEGGSVCLTDDNFPVPCSDYKIRYFCTCDGSTVSVPPLLSTKGSGSTTKAPVLSQNRWSTWINTDSPSTGDGDREMWSKAQQQAFCSNGNVTDIECVTSDGIPFYSTGEIIICSIEGGSVCLNDDNFPVPCSDYKIRYFCTCDSLNT